MIVMFVMYVVVICCIFKTFDCGSEGCLNDSAVFVLQMTERNHQKPLRFWSAFEISTEYFREKSVKLKQNMQLCSVWLTLNYTSGQQRFL